MQDAVACQAFDGGDRRAVGLNRQASAGLDCDAVEQEGARAALAGIAANLRARQAAEIANEINEKFAGFHVALKSPPVDSDLNLQRPPPGFSGKLLGRLYACDSTTSGLRLIRSARG